MNSSITARAVHGRRHACWLRDQRRWVSIALCLSWASGRLEANQTAAGEVRFEQRIGDALPLTAEFTDTSEASHPLRDYFRGRPVVLSFGYARCPQLCSVAGDGLVSALRQIRPAIGRELDVIAISLDPEETVNETRVREHEALHRYGDLRAKSGWDFLRGSPDAVRTVADACGFHYAYDPRSRQFAHPSGFIVLTADGVIARYFFGVDFSPDELARAIARASRRETGAPIADRVLRCFRGEGAGGRYGAIVWRVLSASVALTVLVLAGGIARMLHHERRTRAAEIRS